MITPAPAGDETTYCEVHPDRETSLRCNKCGRLMCVDCAVRTPVGYRCRECVRGQQDRFLKGSRADDAIIFTVCLVATGALIVLEKALPIPFIFVLLLALPAGGVVGELAFRAAGRRRTRYVGYIAAAGALIGGLGGALLATYISLNNLIAAQMGAFARGPSLAQVVELALRDWVSLVLIGIIIVAVYLRLRVKF
jgi:hypothetical protein